jgi:hypothetical protein
VVSKNPTEVLRDFHAVRAYSFGIIHNQLRPEQETLPFLWEIPTIYYSFHHEFKAYLRELRKKEIAEQHHLSHKQSSLSVSSMSVDPLGSYYLPWTGVCRYVQRTFPPMIQKLVDDIWKQVVANATSTLKSSPLQSLIGFLHIRRGDTIDECDTTIPKLKSYLNCSLASISFEKPKQGGNNTPFESTSNFPQQENMTVTLLLGTNEEDPSYMRDLQEMMQNLSIVTTQQPRGNIPFIINVQTVDMESMITSHIQSKIRDGDISQSYLNNLHVFQILREIMNLVDFKLVQRRFRYCNDCDKIVIRDH